MEKKNTILLTIIAIATLLVAVVGATFAYFTAQVTTDNQNNNQTTVETAALVNASMNMGDKIEVANALPGFQTFKTIDIKGSCKFDDATKCTDVNTVITLTAGEDITSFVPTGVTDGTSHVKYTLYKKDNNSTSANKDAKINCTNINDDGSHKNTNMSENITQTGEDGTTQVPSNITKYWDAGVCTPEVGLTEVKTGYFIDNTPITELVTVKASTNDTYYLLIEYINDETAAQDEEQGKKFTINIDFSIGTDSKPNTTVTKTPGVVTQP